MTEIAVGRPLNRRDYRTLTLSALGGALEFYDFIIYVFFVGVVGQLFFPPEMPDWLRSVQAFAIFAAGYLARPLGGIVIAHFGDRFGRKRMFTLSILLMALSTLAIGVMPTFASIGIWAPIGLLAMRVLQGAAIGGEVPGAWVFVAEHAPRHRVGFAAGLLTCGLTAGIMIGSLVASAINDWLTPAEVASYGWRLAFVLGGVFGLVSVYLRRWLEETPVFQEMQARKALAAELPLKTVLRDHVGGVAISMLLTWVLSAGVVVIILMTPALLEKAYGIAPRDALAANAVATLLLTLGCVASGALADRFGAGKVLIVGCLAMAVTAFVLYFHIGDAPHLLVPLYGIAGLSVGVIGAIPFVMIQAFPPAVRFSGISFSYNVAYAVFGGLTPLVVSVWMRGEPLAPAYYVVLAGLLGVAIGIYLVASPARTRNSRVHA
ncbi:Predicted arabinose efflux permease, MFS family [Pseudoxanthobacter soli DSM 19599]|uniref:Predicted arabinose efflux permease, MFS family n=1 Tax=Pseudoxanthobacter soli DSM 19599 TaxID=1123029 RepID=A0A1M7ZRP7_9HYPH|nr:MFS transporter [Pseudoxanthobacter soli]SHO67551.1 Predicted arabinose efflux permease, MFS family [Pseudoxanthobacter soli DSM 19599]